MSQNTIDRITSAAKLACILTSPLPYLVLVASIVIIGWAALAAAFAYAAFIVGSILTVAVLWVVEKVKGSIPTNRPTSAYSRVKVRPVTTPEPIIPVAELTPSFILLDLPTLTPTYHVQPLALESILPARGIVQIESTIRDTVNSALTLLTHRGEILPRATVPASEVFISTAANSPVDTPDATEQIAQATTPRKASRKPAKTSNSGTTPTTTPTLPNVPTVSRETAEGMSFKEVQALAKSLGHSAGGSKVSILDRIYSSPA